MNEACGHKRLSYQPRKLLSDNVTLTINNINIVPLIQEVAQQDIETANLCALVTSYC